MYIKKTSIRNYVKEKIKPNSIIIIKFHERGCLYLNSYFKRLHTSKTFPKVFYFFLFSHNV